MRVNGKRLRVNIMSTIAFRGALWFSVFTGRFTAQVFTTFLDRLARQAGRKVHVIADRHPVHRSKAARAWLAENAHRIELHLMPGYSPELNPDEILGRRPQTTRPRRPCPQCRRSRRHHPPFPASSPTTTRNSARLLPRTPRPLHQDRGHPIVSAQICAQWTSTLTRFEVELEGDRPSTTSKYPTKRVGLGLDWFRDHHRTTRGSLSESGGTDVRGRPAGLAEGTRRLVVLPPRDLQERRHLSGRGSRQLSGSPAHAGRVCIVRCPRRTDSGHRMRMGWCPGPLGQEIPRVPPPRRPEHQFIAAHIRLSTPVPGRHWRPRQTLLVQCPRHHAPTRS
ncbi:hypothetical protein F6W96_39675 [Nocardia terpenica]|uniref:Tc1-like transposase DDE domain-containing protein n=1 Tax=Nocardia terpenica TaxID=455432 RepID=A0A6G9ZDN5_9NOCA|nr:hypothetical protein F6W96_39675 [Nocardia terpenica]